MSASVSTEVRDLFDRYVRFLDDERYDEWLDLFADDGYYGVITHRDYALDTNYVIVGERKSKLADRVRSGARLDRHRRLHLLTAVTRSRAGPGPDATANFALFRNGVPTFCGRYLAWLSEAGGGLRIRKWMVVLDNDPISEVVFLPI